MEAQDPLSELADIHLPGEISAWPPAIGWWLLALALLLALAYGIRLYFLNYVRKRKLFYAITELEQAYQTFSEQVIFDQQRNQAGLNFLTEVNNILRRVALLMFPANQQIPKLNGKSWLTFLDNSSNSLEFSTGAGKALGEVVYQRTYDADGEALYALATSWVEARYAEQQTRSSGKLQELAHD